MIVVAASPCNQLVVGFQKVVSSQLLLIGLATSSYLLPTASYHAQPLYISLDCIFKSQSWSFLIALSLLQLRIEELPRQAFVIHPFHMPWPL